MAETTITTGQLSRKVAEQAVRIVQLELLVEAQNAALDDAGITIRALTPPAEPVQPDPEDGLVER